MYMLFKFNADIVTFCCGLSTTINHKTVTTVSGFGELHCSSFTLINQGVTTQIRIQLFDMTLSSQYIFKQNNSLD